MKSKIQKWGNSLAIRIPKSFAMEAGVSYNSDVDVTIDEGKIIITQSSETQYNLDDFLNQIDEVNIHGEQDFGKPEGSEVW